MAVRTSRSLSVLAPAKINLYLHLTGRRDDGYHLLDSLVCFADIGDQIRVDAAGDSGFSFQIKGPFAGAFSAAERDASPDSANLAVRAVWALARQFGREPDMRVTLVKNLPLCAGIGGGSADAAAMLWALCEWWGGSVHAPYMIDIALSLGADVPVCLACQPLRMRGIGEILSPAPAMCDLFVVLVNPGKPCPTASVFRMRDGGFRSDVAMPEDLGEPSDLLGFLAAQTNMLTDAAMAVVPELAGVLADLAGQEGCRLSRMSGSGATCFGLFDSDRAAIDAATAILRAHPSWWVRAGTLNRPARY